MIRIPDSVLIGAFAAILLVLFLLLFQAALPKYDPADINTDGVVDIKDMSVYLKQYREATRQ